MTTYLEATVVEITDERRGLQKLLVRRNNGDQEPERAYALTDLVGNIDKGDQVVVNTTAVDLDLGTGGWHFVSSNLSQPEVHTQRQGHILKLRYTPMQSDLGAYEEHDNRTRLDSLDNTPVIACFLHSQIAPAVLATKAVSPSLKVAYVMTDSASLAYPISDLAHELQHIGLIDVSITAGQAFGADHETVNVTSGVLAAKSLGADIVVVAPGPGVVGTSTKYGFGSLEMAGHLQSIHHIGGQAILCARYSGADPRQRHRGISHHTRTVLEMTAVPTTVAFPANIEPSVDLALPKQHRVARVDVFNVADLMETHGLNVTTMNRNTATDPAFFDASASAGVLAAQLADKSISSSSPSTGGVQ